jgi:endonuclease/exonuclease/phosphatase family metal-dependent hydrolase
MKITFSSFAVLILLIFTGCSGRGDIDSVKVMTLNLRYDNPADSLNAWPVRATLVHDLIEETEPDIIGLQEVLFHQYEYLDSVLSDYSSAGVGRTDGARKGEMNPVFFRKDRFDKIRTITFWLSETPDVPGSIAWGASLPRIVTWLELSDKRDQQHFFFFNTHFAHDSDSARIMSAEVLLYAVDSIAADFPFIITGDFNMLPSSTGYNILMEGQDDLQLIRDSYVISETKPEGPSFTFNGFSDREGTGRIDYIFVGDNLKVLNHTTIMKKDHGIFVSDHWPVLAEVLLKGQK